MERINIGCGATPTSGWLNFDNSWSVRLAMHPGLLQFLSRFGLTGPKQLAFARVVAEKNIAWADAVKRIPLPDGSVSVVYSSHMLEHLDRTEAQRFLAEVRRVLVPGGVLRIVVPDLLTLARQYADGAMNADAFVAATFLADEKPQGLLSALRRLVVGPRHHHWMYDGASLASLLESAGFHDAVGVPSGTTTISDPGELNLLEQASVSVCVEARR